MNAIIYQTIKSPTGLGDNSSKFNWGIEFVDESKNFTDPIMGWNAMGKTSSQSKLFFNSLESAISYSNQNSIKFEVIQTNQKISQTKSYSDNFK